MKYFWILLLIPMLFIGCATPENTEQKQEIKYKMTPTGLKYIDIEIGKGPSPKMGQRVFVHQIVSINGEVVENTYDNGEPFDFVIGNGETIEGLEEGVSTMKAGGKRQLYVPPDLGFGRRSIRNIPKNSTLTIEVELLRVE